ncbi:MAG TPA: hypothetical protein DCQ30_07820 [Acidimicrobiaceae bacterium]|nr:hypothetical protein [Acidimicrobiaceae bacterium]
MAKPLASVTTSHWYDAGLEAHGPKLPLGPLEGVAKSTLQLGTAFPNWSKTCTWNWVGKAVLTWVLWLSPAT